MSLTVLFVFWFSPFVYSLVCPPFCLGGSNRSSVFLSSFQQVVFVGRVLFGAQTAGMKRVTGVGAEIEHVVEVLQVFRGGIFLKRVGKNVVRVFSGLGAEPGSECSISLGNSTYLFAGSTRSGSSPLQTAQIDVNQCSLVVDWESVRGRDEALWLAQVLQAKDQGRCSVGLVGAAAPVCSCPTSHVCVTNLFQPGQYCGLPRAWCIPQEEIPL